MSKPSKPKQTDQSPTRYATGHGAGKGLFTGIEARRLQLLLELRPTLIQLRHRLDGARRYAKAVSRYTKDPAAIGCASLPVDLNTLHHILKALGA